MRVSLFFWIFSVCHFFLISTLCEAGIPTEPEFFPLQLVDHLISNDAAKASAAHFVSSSNKNDSNKTIHSASATSSPFWIQRYYLNQDHFRGPGHPILLILGGEGAIPPSTGIFYPVVVKLYARQWGALVLEPEHRFYGQSQPVSRSDIDTARAQGLPDPRIKLFTSEQALYDAVRLVRTIQSRHGCSLDKTSPDYCPVVSIGGSYPGWLAAMARLRFPDAIDIGYAASAPMKFYAQTVGQYEYYNHITKVAEGAMPGCSAAVKRALQDFVKAFQNNPLPLSMTSQLVGVCPGSLPIYLQTNSSLFVEELLMVVGYTFANHNMAYYPPSNQTSLATSCRGFLSQTAASSLALVKNFLTQSLAPGKICWNMEQQMPTGKNATLSGGDWSGVGTSFSGESWDFQTCTLLVEAIGFGPGSMFPLRDWTLEWLTEHCQARFGVTPQPSKLVKDWHFDDLLHKTNASRILFTNGLLDGWSVSGIQQNLSESLLAINFPNGAHHSDLNGRGPSGQDTNDIRQGYRQIQGILESWLESFPSYWLHNNKSAAMISKIKLS